MQHTSLTLPPTLDEALLVVFRTTMRYYVSHRNIAMPRIVIETLKAMYQAVDDPMTSQRAVLSVGCSIIKHYGAIRDQAVLGALALAHQALNVSNT